LATQANCFELYGGVNREGQDLRANYALKWHAIKFAKSSGSVVYDLNGLLNDGVSNFKLGFSNEETNLVGTWDLPLSPLYLAWEKVLPFAKKSVQKFNNLRKNQDEK
jgi:lipid II:glycine glycyltransferase (peptidoglycan interpeptide bridge formation enzyme)